MTLHAIVETDNFGEDYPNESFLPIPRTQDFAALDRIAKEINEIAGVNHPRYWKVVSLPYKLQPGFEP